MTRLPHITVIIPTYNACADLRDAVHSVLAQDYPHFDLLVIDNNCTDGTCEMLSDVGSTDSRLRRVCEPEQSVTCARNRGCREAAGELLAFLDHDELAPPHWLSALQQSLEETGAGGVGGPYCPLWEGDPPVWLKRSACLQETLSFMDFGPVRRPVDWLLGGNCLYTRDALARTNYFGDWKSYTSKRSLVGGDDLVMGERMRRAGVPMWFEPAAAVRHKVPRSRQRLAYILRRAFWAGYTDVAIGREWDLRQKSASALNRGLDAIALGLAILPGNLYARLLVRLGYLRVLASEPDTELATPIFDRSEPAPELCSDTEQLHPQATG